MRMPLLLPFPFFCYLLAFLGISLAAAAQTTAPNEWTWIGGNGQSTAQPSSLGTQGVPAPTNLPVPIDGATTWKDSRGRMWLFGGASDATGGSRMELWLFDQSEGTQGEWTWMAPQAQAAYVGNYGPQGVFSAQYYPPARLGAMSWIDQKDRLWLFGGWFDPSGSAFMNDLWVFDPTLGPFGEWAWMGGSAAYNQAGVYGTQGQPWSANSPGARCWGAAWTDAEGNLWLYGGDGLDANGTSGSLNDLWVFRPALGEYGEWTWMGGSSTLPSGVPIAPIGGQFTVDSTPGGRYGSAFWTDSLGHLWLFGGEQDDAQGNLGDMADLWQFDSSQGSYGEWAFMGGDSAKSSDPSDMTGTLGIPSAGNLPAERKWAQFWKDQFGNFWLYGGDDFEPELVFNTWADLWVYSPTLGEWAQVADGPSVPNYGTEYVAAPSNYPGWRDAGVSLAEDDGSALIFGGRRNGIEDENDLWEYMPAPTAAAPVFSLPGGYYVGPQQVTITDATPGAAIYYTTDGSVPSAASNVYSAPVTITPPATLNAVAVLSAYLYSPMGTAVYTNTHQATTPSLSPAGGIYTSAQSVTISDTTPGATIYYTTDGSTPTTGSAVYSSPISVAGTETLKAVAMGAGYSGSVVASVGYIIDLQTAEPTFSVPAGTYTLAQSVAISDTTPGTTIYYTMDGSTPTTGSTVYSSPISVPGTIMINAIATAAGHSTSAVASAFYTIDISPPDFTVTTSPTSLTVTAGSSGTTTISISPANDFNSAVSFSCAGLPSGASCSFSPATVTPSGAAASTTLTVSTTTASAALHRNSRPLFPVAALAALLCCFGFGRRRRLLLSMVVMSAASMGLLGGCGGSSSGGGGPPQSATYTITVNATSGSLAHSTAISLTVN
jgi:hypothetical protein